MTDNPNPDPRGDRDNDHDRRTIPARYPYRDPGAESPEWRDAFARRYRLTQAGEQYLHFNGVYDGPHLVIDHDRCLTGACPYQAEAENPAQLQAWSHAQDREADRGDREAGL
jgi:hypothetical protein